MTDKSTQPVAWRLDVDDTFDLAEGPSSRWCSLRRPGGLFLPVSVEGSADEWLELADAIAARRPRAFKRVAFTPTASGGDFHSPRNAAGERPSASLTAAELDGLVRSIREQLAPPAAPPPITTIAEADAALATVRDTSAPAADRIAAAEALLVAGGFVPVPIDAAAPGEREWRTEAPSADGSLVDAFRGARAELAARGIKVDAAAMLAEDAPAPIDLLLFCPRCSAQHVDQPQAEKGWTNPPHRSHECQACGHVWRPADVATNGVAAIATAGQRDGSPIPADLWVADVRRISRSAVADFVNEQRPAEMDDLAARVARVTMGPLPFEEVVAGVRELLEAAGKMPSDVLAPLGALAAMDEAQLLLRELARGHFVGPGALRHAADAIDGWRKGKHWRLPDLGGLAEQLRGYASALDSTEVTVARHVAGRLRAIAERVAPPPALDVATAMRDPRFKTRGIVVEYREAFQPSPDSDDGGELVIGDVYQLRAVVDDGITYADRRQWHARAGADGRGAWFRWREARGGSCGVGSVDDLFLPCRIVPYAEADAPPASRGELPLPAAAPAIAAAG